MTIEEYNSLPEEQKNNFIGQINGQINNHKEKVHYSIFHRSRKTDGQVILGTHQPPPGRLTAIDELKRSDIKDRKIYLLCLCDCGKWHICRSDAYKKNTSNGGCYSCGCAFESIGEQTIRRLLENNNIPFEQEKIFKDCISPITNGYFRFDFYVDNKYLIEFDGKQHYTSNNQFFTEEKVQQIQYRDKLKNQWCKNNNMPLIRIPYTHLKSLKLEDLLLETSNFIIEWSKDE